MQALVNGVAKLANDIESLSHHTSRTQFALIQQMPGRLDYCAQQLEALAKEAKNLADEAREIERRTT